MGEGLMDGGDGRVNGGIVRNTQGNEKENGSKKEMKRVSCGCETCEARETSSNARNGELSL